MTKAWNNEKHWTDYEEGIVAAEREKVAAWMIKQGYATGHGGSIEDLLKELEWQIEDRIRNIIRNRDTKTQASVPTKPWRLFKLQIGDTFVLRRTKQKLKLVEILWLPGISTRYTCQNLENGQIVRLHHSVMVEQVERHKA